MSVGQSQVCICGPVTKFIAHKTMYLWCHGNYSYNYKRQINLISGIFVEATIKTTICIASVYGEWPSLKPLQLYGAEAYHGQLKCTMGVGQSQVYMCVAVSKFIAHITIYLWCHGNYS